MSVDELGRKAAAEVRAAIEKLETPPPPARWRSRRPQMWAMGAAALILTAAAVIAMRPGDDSLQVATPAKPTSTTAGVTSTTVQRTTLPPTSTTTSTSVPATSWRRYIGVAFNRAPTLPPDVAYRGSNSMSSGITPRYRVDIVLQGANTFILLFSHTQDSPDGSWLIFDVIEQVVEEPWYQSGSCFVDGKPTSEIVAFLVAPTADRQQTPRYVWRVNTTTGATETLNPASVTCEYVVG